MPRSNGLLVNVIKLQTKYITSCGCYNVLYSLRKGTNFGNLLAHILFAPKSRVLMATILALPMAED